MSRIVVRCAYYRLDFFASIDIVHIMKIEVGDGISGQMPYLYIFCSDLFQRKITWLNSRVPTQVLKVLKKVLNFGNLRRRS